MAISNSEKQRRYRERHLGPGGEYERLCVLVRISTKRNLERLASHYGYSITGIVEVLINERTGRVLDSLSEKELRDFHNEEPPHARQRTRS